MSKLNPYTLYWNTMGWLGYFFCETAFKIDRGELSWLRLRVPDEVHERYWDMRTFPKECELKWRVKWAIWQGIYYVGNWFYSKDKSPQMPFDDELYMYVDRP